MTEPWPWPADTPLDRARRVAQSYREALLARVPDLCGQLDRRMVQLGQGWVAPQLDRYHELDLLTVLEAAEYCQVQVKTIYEWRRRGLRITDTPDGARYRVGHLREYRAQRRIRRVRAG